VGWIEVAQKIRRSANFLSVLLLLLTQKQVMGLDIVDVNNEAHKYLICAEFKKRRVG
jgi:hypothetical protein